LLLATKCDPPEIGEARRWWTAAAQAGDHQSQFNLGLLLSEWLEPPDLTEALLWFERAASSGHLRALEALDGCDAPTRLDDETQFDGGTCPA
jgi:Sel1 repeat